MAQDTQNVPKYFADFAVKNADEHAALAKSIADSKGDLSNTIADLTVKNADEHGALAKEMATSRGELRQEMATSRGELREEMSTLRGDIARAETRTTRWFVASLAVGLTIAVTILAYVN